MNDNVLHLNNIPTLMIFRDGSDVGQFVGVQSEGSLLAALNRAFN